MKFKMHQHHIIFGSSNGRNVKNNNNKLTQGNNFNTKIHNCKNANYVQKQNYFDEYSESTAVLSCASVFKAAHTTVTSYKRHKLILHYILKEVYKSSTDV